MSVLLRESPVYTRILHGAKPSRTRRISAIDLYTALTAWPREVELLPSQALPAGSMLVAMIPEQIAHRHKGIGEYVVDGTLWRVAENRREWRVVVTSPTSGRPDERRINLACIVSDDEMRCVEAGIALPNFESVTDTEVSDAMDSQFLTGREPSFPSTPGGHCLIEWISAT